MTRNFIILAMLMVYCHSVFSQSASDSNKYFVISTGANFSFLNQTIEVPSVYVDAIIYLPALLNVKSGVNDASVFGCELGLINGKFTMQPDTFSITLLPIIEHDTINDKPITRIINVQGKKSQQIEINSVQYYFAPSLSLGYGFFSCLHIEGRQRKYKVMSEFVPETGSDDRVKNKKDTSFLSSSQATFGAGIVMDIVKGKFNFYVKPVFGFDDLGNFCWQANVKIETGGIKFGTQLRGVRRENPELLVYLAKEFDITKLAELLK